MRDQRVAGHSGTHSASSACLTRQDRQFSSQKRGDPMPSNAQEVTFDETYDVVVAGYGFAGAVAAITAADADARVLLIEKMPDPGGISICSGRDLRLPRGAPASGTSGPRRSQGGLLSPEHGVRTPLPDRPGTSRSPPSPRASPRGHRASKAPEGDARHPRSQPASRHRTLRLCP